jgi:hypothetical protein
VLKLKKKKHQRYTRSGTLVLKKKKKKHQRYTRSGTLVLKETEKEYSQRNEHNYPLPLS